MSARREIQAVLKKELTDHSRDRRSILSVLGGALMGPLLFAVLFTVIASWARQDKPLEVPVIGKERAPGLIGFLERTGAAVKDAPADYEAQIRAGNMDLALIVPEDYAEDFSRGRTASLELVADSSRNKARPNVARLQRVLAAYGGGIAAQRLLSRGVAPELAMPVRIDDIDLATPERLAATLLNIIPLFLVLACFMGGMNVAIDTMAGERERGSLEALLLHPISRLRLVIGKWLATSLFAVAMVAIAVVAFLGIVRFVPLEDLGVKVAFTLPTSLFMFATVFPLGLLAASAQMLIATFARSYKEGQTYLQMLLLVPTVPVTFLAIAPIQSETWMYAVPVLGQELLVSELMRADPLGPLPFVLATISALAVTALCLLGTARLLGDERIVFGR